jgi:hypothetical protein
LIFDEEEEKGATEEEEEEEEGTPRTVEAEPVLMKAGFDAKEPPFKFEKKVDLVGAFSLSGPVNENGSLDSDISSMVAMEIFLSCLDLSNRSAERESSFFSRTLAAESESDGIRSRNKIESVRVDSILNQRKMRERNEREMRQTE